MSEFIRKATGIVVMYDRSGGYGYIRVDGENRKDAFVSHRQITPDIVELKNLDIDQKVRFSLHQGPRGLEAIDVYPIEKEMVQDDENRFNREEYNKTGVDYVKGI